MTRPAESGIWLGASHLLGRPVPVDEAYPHICGHVFTGTVTGVRVELWRRDCAACAERPGTVRPLRR